MKAFIRLAGTTVFSLAVACLGALATPSIEAWQQPRDQPNGGPRRKPVLQRPPVLVFAQAVFATTGERPFTVESPWNTPIPADAVADPDSDAMISLIDANGPLRSDPTQYTFPVYFADPTTPRVTMACTDGAYVNNLDGTRTFSRTRQIAGVPIPTGTTPSPGRDAQVVVIDVTTGDEYDIWQFVYPNGCRIMTRYVQGVYRSGVEAAYASRGAGVPYMSGLVRPWEIAEGHIDHALAFGFPMVDRARCVWPASKSDGTADFASIPEGARIQLDPTLDVNTLPGLSAPGRVIARALQVYGAYLVDTSGSNKLYPESSVTADWAGSTNPGGPGNPGGPPQPIFGMGRIWDPHPPPYDTASPDGSTALSSGAILTVTTVSAIPVTRLRVLQLPTAFRTVPYRPTHGQCVQ